MSSVRNIYITSSSIFFFIVALFLFMTIGEGYDPFSVKMLTAFAALMIIHQGATRYTMSREANWFQIDIMFLSMFFFVHFWIWIAYQYGFSERGLSPTANLGRVNYSVTLSLLGMATFLVGFNLRPKKITLRPGWLISHRHWTFIGLAIFYSGATLTVSYVLYFGVSAFDGQYTGSAIGGLQTRSIYLLQGILLKLGILIVLIAKSDEKSIIPKCPVSLIVLTCALAMYLVLGDRSEFVFTLAVVMFAYTRYYKKISLPGLLLGVVALALLMSIIEFSRAEKIRSLDTIYEVATSKSSSISSLQGLNSISASGGVMLSAVNAVPKHHSYFYGDLKVLELLGIIPYGRFLFLDQKNREFETSSAFLTWFILGPNSKSGTGTTIVADLYLDFGSVGVVTGLFLLGLIANHVHIKANQMDSLVSAVVLCYFAGLLTVLPRYSFLIIIRGLIWPALFLWLINKLFVAPRQERMQMLHEDP